MRQYLLFIRQYLLLTTVLAGFGGLAAVGLAAAAPDWTAYQNEAQASRDVEAVRDSTTASTAEHPTDRSGQAQDDDRDQDLM